MKRLPSLLLSLVAALGCSSVIGCATTAEDIGTSSDELGASVDVANPSGAYFASIRANGTGCPAGTWEAGISDDGKAFTVTFSGYETSIEPNQSFSVKDCTLAIDLRTPNGFSFSVSSFHYQGYAILEQPGMTAKQTAKYYFRGNPVPAGEIRSDMTGPYNDSYVFSDEIGVADLVWSPCGASRTLEAQTRLVLQNNAANSGAGYLNTTSVDGEVKTVFRFGLSWKKCDGSGDGSSGGSGGGGSSGGTGAITTKTYPCELAGGSFPVADASFTGNTYPAHWRECHADGRWGAAGLTGNPVALGTPCEWGGWYFERGTCGYYNLTTYKCLDGKWKASTNCPAP